MAHSTLSSFALLTIGVVIMVTLSAQGLAHMVDGFLEGNLLDKLEAARAAEFPAKFIKP
jgi:hypothetical protein